MRGDRLLSILILLQTHRRLTARQLAERLEVSERTILRDMDALSSSGVPVIADRGVGGGWSLLDGFETKLTGLKARETTRVAAGGSAGACGICGPANPGGHAGLARSGRERRVPAHPSRRAVAGTARALRLCRRTARRGRTGGRSDRTDRQGRRVVPDRQYRQRGAHLPCLAHARRGGVAGGGRCGAGGFRPGSVLAAIGGRISSGAASIPGCVAGETAGDALGEVSRVEAVRGKTGRGSDRGKAAVRR